MNCLELVPTDIFRVITPFLDFSDVLNLTIISKDIREKIWSFYFIETEKGVYVDDRAPDFILGKIRRAYVKNYCSKLKDYPNIYSVEIVSDVETKYIEEMCKGRKEIFVRNIGSVKEIFARDIGSVKEIDASFIKNAEKVTLNGYKIRNIPVCDKLNYLDIFGSDRICVQEWDKFTSLETLRITHLEGSEVEMLSKNKKLFLTTIEIKETKFLENIMGANLIWNRNVNISHLSKLQKVILRECDNIKNLHVLKDVCFLDLSGSNFTDVSELGNGKIRELNLEGVPVEDVSMLGYVHTLNLSGTKVVNVKTLGKVHTLNLSYTDVKDVSALKDVYDLNLEYTKVKDASMLRAKYLNLTGTESLMFVPLGEVYKLDLSRTRITDVKNVGKVTILDLSSTKVRRVSNLGHVRELNLMGTGVKNIQDLSNVEILNISHTDVTDISSLYNTKKLEASYTYIFDVSGLKNITELNINNTLVEDLSPLMGGKIRELNIAYTPINKIPKLDTLKKLTINKEIDLSGVPNLISLVVLSSDKLDLRPLKKLKYLQFQYCKEVIGLRDLKELRELTVFHKSFADGVGSNVEVKIDNEGVW